MGFNLGLLVEFSVVGFSWDLSGDLSGDLGDFFGDLVRGFFSSRAGFAFFGIFGRALRLAFGVSKARFLFAVSAASFSFSSSAEFCAALKQILHNQCLSRKETIR